jgi:hypothetical protein
VCGAALKETKSWIKNILFHQKGETFMESENQEKVWVIMFRAQVLTAKTIHSI